MGDFKQSFQALVDLVVTVGVVIFSRKILASLLKILARHTADAGYLKTLFMTIVISVACICMRGPALNFPWYVVLALAIGLSVLGIFFLAAVPLKRAFVISILFVGIAGALQVGARGMLDRMMPGHRSLQTQMDIATGTLNKMSATGAAVTNSPPVSTFSTVKGKLAKLVIALAELTKPGESNRMEGQVTRGLAEIRAMRKSATYREDVAMNGDHADEIRTKLATAPPTNNQAAASAVAALAGAGGPPRAAEADPDLDAAMARLKSNFSGTNGAETISSLANSLQAVKGELGPTGTNQPAGGVDAATALAALAGAAGGAPTGGGAPSAGGGAPTAGADMGPVADETTETDPNAFQGFEGVEKSARMNAGPSTAPKTEYVKPPPEVQVQGVMVRPGKAGVVICNNDVVPIGGTVTITKDGTAMVFRVEAIENGEVRWSRVEGDAGLMLTPFGTTDTGE